MVNAIIFLMNIKTRIEHFSLILFIFLGCFFLIIPKVDAELLLPGDFDRNGKVDLLDFNIFIDYYGQSGRSALVADLNHNGKVDLYDFNIFIKYYGQQKRGQFPKKKSQLNFCANLNQLHLTANDYRDPELLLKIKGLGIRYLRIPGGTVANYWDWSRGGLIDIESLKTLINHPQPDLLFPIPKYNQTHHSIENTATLLHTLDMAPIFVLNMTSSSLETEIAYLKEFENQGIPIRYVELGNELYFQRNANQLPNPSLQKYVQLSNEWISRLRTEFPKVEVSYVAALNKRNFNSQASMIDNFMTGEDWNSQVRDIKASNASVHYYYKSRGISSLDENCGILKYCVRDRFDVSQESFSQYLGSPFYDFKEIDPMTVNTLGDNKKLWLTEFNIAEKSTAAAGTWAHGLFVLNQAITLLANDQIEIACVHSLISDTHWALIWKDSHEYSAAGHILSLFGRAVGDAITMDQLNLPNVGVQEIIIDDQKFHFPKQYGYKFTDQEGNEKFFLVNLSSQKKAINTNEFLSEGKMWQLFQEPGKAVFKKEDVQQQNNAHFVSNVYLKPYAVALLEPL